MEQEIIQQFLQGAKEVFLDVNWKFVVVIMTLGWLFNEGVESETKFKWLNFIRKLSPQVRVLILGVLVSFPFAWLDNLNGKIQYAGLFYGLMAAMVIWKLGVNKIFDWLKISIFKPNGQ